MEREELLKVSKPILFNTEMVRAILDGRKTVTRRLIKARQLIGIAPDKCKNGTPEEFLKEKKHMFKPYCDMTDAELINTAYEPPYQPGDIRYVRETWCDDRQFTNDSTSGRYFYKASESDDFTPKWKPSIHMPKEVSRIFLKVKDVRVERLHEITEEQAKAEGAIDNRGFIHSPDNEYDSIHTAKEHFEQIWNSTIKKSDLCRFGWNANPWVWVIEFERIEE